MPTRSQIVFACLIWLEALGVALASEHRSRTVAREFQETHPCPSTGLTTGACPGYVRYHVVPLACGGPDTVENLQWQTIRAARAKDKLEREACSR